MEASNNKMSVIKQISFDPILEGAVSVNGGGGHAFEKEL